MQCPNCAAPLNSNDEVCKYCGMITPYGESMLKERSVQEEGQQSRHAEKNLSQRRRKSVAVMIEGALCIALCIVLEKINLFSMPQGGSVDFELIPLLLFAYRRGIRNGIWAGAVTGIIKIVLGGYFLNVIQVILDYPLAYACVGLAAVSPRIIGLLIAALGQITCSVISGVVFFAQYAPEGQSPLMYSIMYNGPVLGAKYILSGIVAMFLWKVLERDLPVRD